MQQKGLFLCIWLHLLHNGSSNEKHILKDLCVNKQCTLRLTLDTHLAWQVNVQSICRCFSWYIMYIYSGMAVREGPRGLGHALSCSCWRSSLPVGNSSFLRFSSAAQSPPELSAAGCSPHTGLWSTRLICRSCAARKIKRK